MKPIIRNPIAKGEFHIKSIGITLTGGKGDLLEFFLVGLGRPADESRIFLRKRSFALFTSLRLSCTPLQGR